MKEHARQDEEIVSEVIAVILAIALVIVLFFKSGEWLGVLAS
jgi:hypothetical protein